MKVFLVLLLFLTTSCASNSRILEADAKCNKFTSKKAYRDCLIGEYNLNKQEQIDTINCIIDTLCNIAK